MLQIPTYELLSLAVTEHLCFIIINVTSLFEISHFIRRSYTIMHAFYS